MNRKIKSEFSRMIQIPQWGRPEKSEVLTKEMENMSQILQAMQEICHTLSKGIKDGIPNYPGEPEKRTLKTPEWVLAQTMRKCSRDLEKFYSTGFGYEVSTMLTAAAETEELLAKDQIQYELQVEENLFKPLTDLENDYKTVAKLKKQLHKLTADMENAKKKYQGAARQSTVGTSENNSVKLAQMKDEFEDLSKQVDHARDALTTEILSMMSREGDCSDVILKHVKLKAEYHRQALKVFDSLLPKMEETNDQLPRPLFGADLSLELKRCKRKIASVLEICTAFLYQNSLEEEGLFRLAGGASKVKMFKAAFDAQVDYESSHQNEVLDLMTYHSDHHAVASTLKCYLRELQEPITTSPLYNDWMDAVKISDPSVRRQVLTGVISKLPPENYDNLAYLIKFLAAVASRSDKNKMTASNLAIVIAPNLFSNADNDKTLYDTVAANLQHTVVDLLITYQRDFFPGEFEPSTTVEVGTVRNATPKDGGTTFDLSGGSESGGSPRPATPPADSALPASPKLTGKKAKKAPAPPPIPRRTENLLPPPSTGNGPTTPTHHHPTTPTPYHHQQHHHQPHQTVHHHHPTPISGATPSTACSPPAVPADDVTVKPHFTITATTTTKLYPDVTQLTIAPPIAFEPTILPVSYTPSAPSPDSPDPLTTPTVTSRPLPATTVVASPSPAPRTRVKGPGVSTKAELEATSSSENGHPPGGDGERRPDRPPPPPPRQVSDSTYL